MSLVDWSRGRVQSTIPPAPPILALPAPSPPSPSPLGHFTFFVTGLTGARPGLSARRGEVCSSGTQRGGEGGAGRGRTAEREGRGRVASRRGLRRRRLQREASRVSGVGAGPGYRAFLGRTDRRRRLLGERGWGRRQGQRRGLRRPQPWKRRSRFRSPSCSCATASSSG